jgi:thiamine biosynthesis lipoprotein
MGCTFEVLLPAGLEDAVSAAEAALDEVDRLDRSLSVYRPDSEVSRLNAAAGLGPRAVGESLLDLLQLSARLAEDTNGAYDPAAGAIVRAWGFDAGERSVPSEGVLQAARERSGLEHIHMDQDAGTVALSHPGVELNFGAIGKGFALDRAVAILRERCKVPSAFLQGGRSSAYALGTAPGEKRGWMVELRDPETQSDLIATIWLRNQGLATSGAAHRSFEAKGKRWGHILDPRTGRPAEGMRSVSVVAPSAAEADALATAFFILGPESAGRYAATHPGVGGILVPEAPSEKMVSVVGDLEAEFSPEFRVEYGENGA